MGAIQTKTVCTFPFIFPKDTLEEIKLDPSIVSDLSEANCTKTYAQVLDPIFLVLQIVIGLMFLSQMPIIILRFFTLKKFARETHTEITGMIQLKAYALVFLICVICVLEAIDLQGFRGVMPHEIYYIGDEIVAFSVLTAAVISIDFFAKTGKDYNADEGIPRARFYFFIVISFCNFVGLQILGMIFYEKYFLFEAIKNIGGTLMCLLTYIIGGGHMRQIIMKLQIADSTAKSTVLAVQMIKKKYRIWRNCCIGGGLMMTASALINFTKPDHTWYYDIEENPDIILIGIKLVFFAVVRTCLNLFQVPRTKQLRKSSTLSTAIHTRQSAHSSVQVAPA